MAKTVPNVLYGPADGDYHAPGTHNSSIWNCDTGRQFATYVWLLRADPQLGWVARWVYSPPPVLAPPRDVLERLMQQEEHRDIP